MTTILSISGLFSLNSATSVYADSLTLTIPSSPLSLDLNPTVNNGFATTSGSFSVKTDNSAGYTTSIRAKNESGENSLINGNNKLTSISGPISEDTFKNGSAYINMWGWLPSKLNSEDNTNYQIAPGSEEVVLDKTETANAEGQDYNISLAAKVASDTPTGTYTNTFVVTALSNASPQKEYEPVECWGLSEGETSTFTDPRDGTTYKIARLKDNKCWMIENLRITGSSTFKSGHTKTLNSSDSDLPDGATYELPTNATWTDNYSNANSNHAYYANNTSYGAYYTWYTATAGTGTSSMTTNGQNATGSICPKGWRLPTSGSDANSDFQLLAKQYTNGSRLVATPTPAFTYAGSVSYSDGVLSSQGSVGYYWSSTVYNQDYAYNLLFNSSNVGPANTNYRPRGFSVRCVARGEKPENKGTMQTVDQWGDSVKEGETVLATDERDNTTYSVARLEDGELWMTQNLRIGSNTQQTVLKPDTSDVASDFTLPVGTTKRGSKTDTTGWYYQQYDTSHIYINSDTNYGGYYTWFAATAGEGTESKSSGDTSHSICPKGWRLPTSTEITTLTEKYDTTTRNNNPPNFGSTVWAGYCDEGGCPRSSGSIDFWWSSTARSSTSAYGLYSNSSDFDLYGNYYKGYGYSVRCVQKEYKSMQKVDEWGSEVKTGESTEAKDERDGNIYTVARLNDGKLWMTENLRITGDSVKAAGVSVDLNSTNTDISGSGKFTIPDSNIDNFNVGSSGFTTTDINNDAAYVATTSYSDPTYGDKSFDSGYYTWHTATAGTGTADQTTQGWNAPSSICPKGWKLPTGGSGGDFQTLTNAYSIGNNTAGSNTLRGEPLNFTYAGSVGYSRGALDDQGSYGLYWSSTASGNAYAYRLFFNSSGVRPTDYNDRPGGLSVRCVAR